MRIIVALAPTNKRGTKTEYTRFRKLLVADGFTMVQPEVYIRTVSSNRAARSHVKALENAAPSTGRVCVVSMTERQFSKIVLLTGKPSAQEQLVGAKSQVDL
ncbi:MAG: CRISPR-associated endonuclease Cas2 [Eggerthellaceae bacterium]|jgi:CRISPR-associated protein Cas2